MAYNPYVEDQQAVAVAMAMAKQTADAEFGDYSGPARAAYEFCLQQKKLAMMTRNPDDSVALVVEFSREADRAREAARREMAQERKSMAVSGFGKGLGFSGAGGLLGAATPIQDALNGRMTEAAEVMAKSISQQMYSGSVGMQGQAAQAQGQTALNGGSYNTYGSGSLASSFRGDQPMQFSGGQSLQAPLQYAADPKLKPKPEIIVAEVKPPGKRAIEF